MIKRTLRFAIGPSVGVVVGSLIYRMTNPNLYNEAWPNGMHGSLLVLNLSCME